jgi:hypothetical protein
VYRGCNATLDRLKLSAGHCLETRHFDAHVAGDPQFGRQRIVSDGCNGSGTLSFLCC